MSDQNKAQTLKYLDQMIDLIDNMPEEELIRRVDQAYYHEKLAKLDIHSPEFLRLT
jgi:hypothetical protein